MEQEGATKPAKKLGTKMLPSVRTTETMKNVGKLAFRPDSFTIRQIMQQLGLSYGTVRQINARSLAGKKRCKTKTHHLSDKQVAQRVLKVPSLLEHIKRVNSDFYVKHVLKPLFKKNIPEFYGKQAKSVALHHDSAAAHTALTTVWFLQNNNYRFIPAADWSNSPDLSPMDYSINRILRDVCGNIRPKILLV
ncbi:hypothetical protein BV898_17466 [Hypsibius exemplaris]|uniref:Tc1-like transposase DDE domain-containing protein n=1 Tax=Hypsibius exemplaris TaxID=2072580 RepID=A0A9X6RMH6_HYPEX|nr:hypothetical protein BV898_17466 [Hypsibius exemplaris]